MLTDKGLATDEDREDIRKCDEYRKNHTACIGSRICEKCNHLISDTICLCVPIFTCPNCSHKNGEWFAKITNDLTNFKKSLESDSAVIKIY